MTLAQLLEESGVEERCVLRSGVGIMALHGGSQDRGTDRIAGRVADEAFSSFYAIVQPPQFRRHIPSRFYDPADSPALQAFLKHIDVAISVHGFGRDSFGMWIDPERGLILEPYGPARRFGQEGPLTGIILGGQNSELLERSRRILEGRFAGYHVADPRLRLGFHRTNPVNLPSGNGVQIELPPGLRGIGPYGERPTPVDEPIVDEVVAALVELALEAPDTVRIG
jgi:phage replication-related protein YjqB (UPF0714/DUF867 family)